MSIDIPVENISFCKSNCKFSWKWTPKLIVRPRNQNSAKKKMKNTSKRYSLDFTYVWHVSPYHCVVEKCKLKGCTKILRGLQSFQKLKSTLEKLAKGNENYKLLLEEANKIQKDVEVEKKAKELKIQPKYKHDFPMNIWHIFTSNSFQNRIVKIRWSLHFWTEEDESRNNWSQKKEL